MTLPAIMTPLVRLQWPGRGDILVKDESHCPTGTFKDRLGWRLVDLLTKEKRRGDLLISCITMGNTARSVAVAVTERFKPQHRPKVLAIFPEGFSARTIGPDNAGHTMQGSDLFQWLDQRGAHAVEHDLARGFLSKNAIASIAEKVGIGFSRHLDVSSGLIEAPSYPPILEEALAEASDNIEVVVVPVGAGVLFEEIVEYIEQKHLPIRVIGVSSLQYGSIADKLYARYSEYYDELVASNIASHRRYPRHQIVCEENGGIRKALQRIPRSLRAEPSAAAAFSLLDNTKLIPADAKVLVVNTGDGIL